MIDHSTLPSVANARLPASYEQAKTALAICGKIDECKQWADRAEALASYAKQAGDDSMRKLADRIQARAIRRCGELLKQVESAQGGDRRSDQRDGAVPLITRTQAATAAGLSERQRKTALRVANVDDESFEQQIESDNPPTVTALAEQGKKSLVDLKGRDPKEFNRALHFEGLIATYAKKLGEYDLAAMAEILTDKERQSIKQLIAKIDALHDSIMMRL